MQLDYRLTSLSCPFTKKAKDLFESSFPEDERPPFEMTVSWENSSFFGVFLDGEYVALADVVECEDLVYLFFLAVEPSHQNEGIGTKILEDLGERYPDKRLFLLAEVVDPKYEDYESRKRRMAFYAKSGFLDSGLIIKEFDVDYSLLYRGSPVGTADFLKVMGHLIGPEMLNRYYSHLME